MKYVINNTVYPTQKALLDECRRQLREGPNYDFLASLIERHPRRDSKVGCGIAGFFIGPDGYGKSCFWLRRLDGTSTDFSFHECVKASSEKSDFRAAARREIKDQILDFKRNAFPAVCPYTGEKMTHDNCHVDHVPPMTFARLADEWLMGRPYPETMGHIDGSTEIRFKDRTLAEQWWNYHRQHAQLRLVSKQANLSTVKKEANDSNRY